MRRGVMMKFQQLTVYDVLEDRDELNFDRSILKKIKGLEELRGKVPEYEIILINPDFKGRTVKRAIWVGYFHSISDSGWNYDREEVRSWRKVKEAD